MRLRVLGCLQHLRDAREAAVGEQQPERARPQVALADVLVAVQARAERCLRVVQVEREDAARTVEELRDYLAGEVARWQLPERWAFIEAVPKTSVGKFDKKSVRAQYADGALSVETLG